MTYRTRLVLSAVLVASFPNISRAEDVSAELAEVAAELATTTYQLAYKFHEDEEIRYRVEHRATVDTRISGTRQVTRSTSKSTKVWQVQSVSEDQIEFVHMVRDVDMWQKATGRDEVSFNSETDDNPPAEYEQVAESLGKTLASITINSSGQVIAKEASTVTPDLGFGSLVVPLPKEPIKLGHTWAVPKKHKLRLRDGRIKEVSSRMRYRLEKVQTGVATISVKTQILTPVHDATLKSQLVQQLSNGEVKFDIDAGRVISKQLDWSENVIGFNGPDSNMKYLAQFVERLLQERTAKIGNRADPTGGTKG